MLLAHTWARPCVVDVHHTGVRLNVALVHQLRVEGMLKDPVSGAKTLGNVALRPVIVGEHVIDRGHGLGQSLIGRHLRVQRRGRAVHGFDRVKHRGQFLVFYVNQVEGFLRRLQGFCRHRRDFLAHEQHPVPRQHRDIAQQPAHSAVGEILAGEDRMHAGDCAGPGGVDAQNVARGDRDCAGLSPTACRAAARRPHTGPSLTPYPALRLEALVGLWQKRTW